MEKDITLAIQMKLALVLIIKRNVQLENQKNALDYFLKLDLLKSFVKVLKDFVSGANKNLKENKF